MSTPRSMDTQSRTRCWRDGTAIVADPCTQTPWCAMSQAGPWRTPGIPRRHCRNSGWRKECPGARYRRSPVRPRVQRTRADPWRDAPPTAQRNRVECSARWLFGCHSGEVPPLSGIALTLTPRSCPNLEQSLFGGPPPPTMRCRTSRREDDYPYFSLGPTPVAPMPASICPVSPGGGPPASTQLRGDVPRR